VIPKAMHKIRNSENEGTRENCAPNSLNVNENPPNMVHVCGYKLPINW